MFLKIFFVFKDKFAEGRRESKKSFISWAIPYRTSMSTAEQIQNWSQELLLALPNGFRVPRTPVILHYLLKPQGESLAKSSAAGVQTGLICDAKAWTLFHRSALYEANRNPSPDIKSSISFILYFLGSRAFLNTVYLLYGILTQKPQWDRSSDNSNILLLCAYVDS